MSPSVYSSLGNRLHSKKLNLWIVSVLFTLIVITNIAFSKGINEVIPYQVPFGIALLTLIVSWGILLAVYLYGPEGKLEPSRIQSYEGVKRSLSSFISWYGAILLSVWFLSGVIILPWFLLMQVYG
ncbi:MAG: hypothetical protein KZQ93_19875 [Candidatus Thiodiazotropha sp. (ex Monitilora ramsayi)]|nr:hypothetical protein [Candidatus Thiodiazotropha sp. (ex Monitilora ramsayi)]